MTKSRQKLMSLVVAVMYVMCVLVSAPVTAYAATSGTHVAAISKTTATKNALAALKKLPATKAAAEAYTSSEALNKLVKAADTAIAAAKKLKLGYTKFTNYGRLKIAKAAVVVLAAKEKAAADAAAAEAAAKAAAEKLAADTAAAKTVTDLITALPAVTALVVADEAKVVAARTAYTALNADAMKLVTNLATLTAAETKIAELKGASTFASVTAINATNTGITVPVVDKVVVPANAKFELVAKTALDATTVNASTVVVTQDGAPIARTVALNTDKTKITVTPTVAMDSTKTYKMTVIGVKTASAVTLVDYTINFTVSTDVVVTSVGYIDNNAAEVAFPSTNVLNSGTVALGNTTNDKLVFTVNKSLDAGTVTASNIRVMKVGGAYVAPDSVSYDAANKKIYFVFINGTQIADAKYQFSAQNIKALDGTTLPTITRDFFYSTPAVTYTLQGVLAAGTTNKYPKLVGALLESTYYQGFSAQFTANKQLDAASVNSTNVVLNKVVDGVATAVPATVAFAGGMISVTPVSNLDENATYNVVIDGVTDTTGLTLTASTTTFTTGVYTPVTITGVTPAQGSVVTKANAKLVVTFSKPVVDTSVSYGNASTWAGNNTIIMYNAANSTDTINLASATKTWNTAKTQLTLDVSSLVGYGKTYTVKIAGNAAGGSTAPLAAASGTVTKLETDYVYTLQVAADSLNPAPVKYFSGSSFATATEITPLTNVDNTYNVYVLFNKVLSGGTVSADNTADTTINGNVVLEKYVPATGTWTQVAMGAATLALTNNSTGTASYITIPTAKLSNNARMRVKLYVQDTNGTKTIVDASTNYMTQDYSFTFVTGSGPSLKKVNDTATVAADTTTSTSAAGATSLTDTSLNAAITASYVGKPVTVKLDDATWFTTSIASIAANTINLSDALPVSVTSGNAYFVGTNVGSYTTGVNVKQPIIALLANPSSAVLNANGAANTVRVADADYLNIGSPVAGDKLVVTATDIAPTTFTVVSVASAGGNTTITIDASAAAYLMANTATVYNLNTAVDTSTLATTVKLQTSAGVDVASTISTLSLTNGSVYVVIKPTAKLAGTTSYKVVAANEVDLLGNASASSNFSFTTASDVQVPTVLTKSPVTGTTNVALDASIVFTFDQPLTLMADGNNTLANYKSVAGVGNGGAAAIAANEPIIVVATGAGAQTVDSYLSADGKTLTIVPASNLPGNDIITVTIAKEIGNSAGTLDDTYAANVTLTFQTMAATSFPAAYVGHGKSVGGTYTQIGTSKSTPVVMGLVGDDLAVEFSKDNINKENATFVLTDLSNSNTVCAISSKSNTDAGAGTANVVVVNPLLDLVSGHTYKLEITGLVDGDGVAMAATTLYYTAP